MTAPNYNYPSLSYTYKILKSFSNHTYQIDSLGQASVQNEGRLKLYTAAGEERGKAPTTTEAVIRPNTTDLEAEDRDIFNKEPSASGQEPNTETPSELPMVQKDHIKMENTLLGESESIPDPEPNNSSALSQKTSTRHTSVLKKCQGFDYNQIESYSDVLIGSPSVGIHRI